MLNTSEFETVTEKLRHRPSRRIRRTDLLRMQRLPCSRNGALGRLKMRDMKLRLNQKSAMGKCKKGLCDTMLQGWKMREILLWKAKNNLLSY